MDLYLDFRGNLTNLLNTIKDKKWTFKTYTGTFS